MPDNPHPHPQEFNQTVQEILILFVQLLVRNLTSISPQAISETSATRNYSTSYFVRTPRD